MPVFLAGRFDRTDRLTAAQQRDIITCRLAFDTGWTLDTIEALSFEAVGKLLSYQEGLDLLRRGPG